MAPVVADTHAIVWYLSRPDRLSVNALQALREAAQAGSPIYVASISLVELRYLVEKGRLPESNLAALDVLLDDSDSGLVLVPLDIGVARALRRIPRSIIPDMPDRIIAATALHRGLALVTHDRLIQASSLTTIW